MTKIKVKRIPPSRRELVEDSYNKLAEKTVTDEEWYTLYQGITRGADWWKAISWMGRAEKKPKEKKA